MTKLSSQDGKVYPPIYKSPVISNPSAVPPYILLFLPTLQYGGGILCDIIYLCHKLDNKLFKF